MCGSTTSAYKRRRTGVPLSTAIVCKNGSSLVPDAGVKVCCEPIDIEANPWRAAEAAFAALLDVRSDEASFS